ncbi:hypothetical protein BB561_005045 [Smittium simulii]|uniref:t-SNARE coiled-coil homology domain-containing protein n=1 Tax=Smittium simulii TaxID=133385 RepID=A0A2T9YCK5_9FUNG|nr:hypothetical protein BB561_005045 [Smittium simulii]
MSRDRYEELRAIRKESLAQEQFPGYNTEKAELEPFYQNASEVEDRIEKMRALVNKVSGMHEENLVAVNATREKEVDKNINILNMEIRSEMSKIKLRIKEIGVMANESSNNTGDVAVKRGRHMALLKKFREEIEYTRNRESDSKQKYRSRIAKQIRIVDPMATEEQIDQAIESGAAQSIFQLSSMNYEGQARAKQTLEQVEMRNEELKKIEKNILDLNEMFIEVQDMTIKQQEGINNIENAVQSTADYTVVANENIDSAVVYRRSSRKVTVNNKLSALMGMYVLVLQTNYTLSVKMVNNQIEQFLGEKLQF